MRRIQAKEEVCIGCHLCEIWCTVEHSRSKDIIKAFKKEPKIQPRVQVEERRPTSFAVQCRFCEEPYCVFSCISGAMRIDENGAITHDAEKCLGCWTCIMVCPYGAISIDAEGKIASKCDLCAGRSVPSCVEHCPNEALVLV